MAQFEILRERIQADEPGPMGPVEPSPGLRSPGPLGRFQVSGLPFSFPDPGQALICIRIASPRAEQNLFDATQEQPASQQLFPGTQQVCRAAENPCWGTGKSFPAAGNGLPAARQRSPAPQKSCSAANQERPVAEQRFPGTRAECFDAEQRWRLSRRVDPVSGMSCPGPGKGRRAPRTGNPHPGQGVRLSRQRSRGSGLRCWPPG